jgi:dTDP-4-dehydrorhamnose reductase
VGADFEDFDITNREQTHDFIVKHSPDAVVHCSAWTAVDAAEDVPEKAAAVNVEGPRNIAQVCKEIGAKMVYISTDYVFPGDGEEFYEVDDCTGPSSVYGRTKLGGELAVKELLDKYFIVRISWVFGKNGNNFVRTMLRLAETRTELGVVCDQIGSPTYTADLAPLLCDMIESEKYGTYHATNEGLCSWAEFAEEIFRLAGKEMKVNHILTKDYPVKAKRPLNSRLSKQCLEDAGFCRLPSWQDALARYVEVLKGE